MGLENIIRPVHHDVVGYQRRIQASSEPLYLRYKGAYTKFIALGGLMALVGANAFYGFGLLALDKPLPKKKVAAGSEDSE